MTGLITEPKPHAERARSGRPFRTDIQALRAVAVGAVVLNHLWPTRLSGGYVGVDVFFVISGYLITAHLVGELAATGRVRFAAFYARRVRRLLPAALLVLGVSAVLSWMFLPYPRWERNAAEIASSATYFENWFLAARSVNYSAFNDAASVAQHYWSLSVEEQFYILWPLVLVAGAIGLRRWGTATLSSSLRWVVLLIAGASLLASYLYTLSYPSEAYFATFTRGWEFAVGGAVALWTGKGTLRRGLANLLSFGGVAAICASAFAFNSATSFPGVAAILPVAGTAAVIVAGAGQPRLWHTWISASPPVQWLGNISYSLYLWHWPIIVVAPFALGRELSGPVRVAVLALALVLAWLTKRYVEDGAQRWGYWRDAPRRSFALMIAGMVAVLVLALALGAAGVSRSAADSPTGSLSAGSCDGPRALANRANCANPFEAADSTVMSSKNEYFFTPPECGEMLDTMMYGDKKTMRVCDFSDGGPAPEVWIVGDSHAQQWQGAIFDIARDRRWRVTTSYFGGCPVAEVAFVGFRTPWAQSDAEVCQRWSRDVSDAVVHAAPELVFTSMAARLHLVDDGSGRSASEQLVEGMQIDWTRWDDAGSRVVVIADPPLNGEVRNPDCVVLNPVDPLRCAVSRAEAYPPDPLLVAAHQTGGAPVVAIDLTDRFCDDQRCYAVIGKVPVYYDKDHLNLQYVRMLGTDIAEAIDAAGNDVEP